MSEEEIIKKNASKHTKKPSKTAAVIFSYFLVPAVFVSLACLLFSPLLTKAKNTAQEYIAKAESVFAADSSDIKISENNCYLSDLKRGTVSLEKQFACGEFIGNLKCEDAGLNTKIYYGNSAAALRSGAALLDESGFVLPGRKGTVYINGYSTTVFKSIQNAAKGSIIKITSSYGLYEYRVTSFGLSENTDNSIDADLLLVTSVPEVTFGNYGKLKYYVSAEMISGPQLVFDKEAEIDG